MLPMFEKYLTQSYITDRAVIQIGIWIITFCATMIDMWTGIDAAKFCGEKIHSKGLRNTITKYLDYWRFQVMAMFVDVIGSLIPQYQLPYASMLICVAIVVIEAKSVIENYKKKKSSASEIVDIASEIVKCKDIESAKQLLSKISKDDNN